MTNPQNGPFNIIARAWTDMLKRADDFKKKRFEPEAREGLRFFCGPYDFFFKEMRNDKFFSFGKSPSSVSDIVVTNNKVAEVVQIFGPVLYQRNPVRRASIPTPPVIDPRIFGPQMQQMMMQAYQQAGLQHQQHQAVSSIFEAIENITPNLLDLKTHSRQAIDEALITGLGLLWHDYTTFPGTGVRACGSFWGSSQDFLMDPDAKSIDTIKWCARATTMPKWEAERKWRLYPGTLKGSTYSTSQVAAATMTGENAKPDLVTVWEIWSKQGVGGRLPMCEGITWEAKAAYDAMGDFCYLAIVKDHPWPLNLPPSLNTDEEGAWPRCQRAVQWPTPYWLEGGWPFTPFYFHTIPGDPWPMSHMTPAMGELKFLNWAFAMICRKIKTTCRDIYAVDDAIVPELEQALKYGDDLSFVKIPGLEGRKASDFIEMLQAQQWNSDIWKVMEAVSQQFDLRVGLTDLMYGMSARQMRSAAEADRKYEAVNVRPDDMADKVEEAMSRCADREKLCNFWHLDPADVGGYLGPVGAAAWQLFVYQQDPRMILDIHMRIESDSMKKPNRANMNSALTEAMQMLAQPLFTAAQAGMVDPFNALVKDWTESVGLPNPGRYAITLPPNVPEPVQPPTDSRNQTAA